jgi:hypothetical protein
MASWTKGKREKSGGNFFNGTLCVLLLSRVHSTPFRTPGKVIVNVNLWELVTSTGDWRVAEDRVG